jgi:hypothetical protein
VRIIVGFPAGLTPDIVARLGVNDNANAKAYQ